MGERPGDLSVGVHQPGGGIHRAEPVAALGLGHLQATRQQGFALRQIARQFGGGGLAVDFILRLRRKNGHGAALARGEGVFIGHGEEVVMHAQVSRGGVEKNPNIGPQLTT